MEILEIRSTHDLTALSPSARQRGTHSYQVNCRQFTSVQRLWHHDKPQGTRLFDVMTLNFERLWMTESESQQVAAAIQAMRSPVVVDCTQKTIEPKGKPNG